MFIKDCHFLVILSSYAKSHFCKYFSKKYSQEQWNITWENIKNSLERSYLYQNKTSFSVINFSQEKSGGIFKLEFRVAGTKFSTKTSGNRVVFFLDNEKELIEILLVYGKTHAAKQNETQWIKEQIKANFLKYKKYCV